jgi:hypothetical protein
MKKTLLIGMSMALNAPFSYAAPPVDADSDGIPAFRDCDDTDPSIGRPLRWYADSDGDGWGDSSSAMFSCTPVSGYVRNRADCDDTNSFIRRPLRQYLDSDGDGFGDISSRVHYCGRLSGYVRNHLDCDDSDSAISPDAEELFDGIDNDCDGDVDNNVTFDVSYADNIIVGENGSDSAGISLSIIDDINSDGNLDVLIGAYGNDDGGVNAGAAYILTDFSSSSILLSSAHAKLIGENGSDYAGQIVASGGDINNDGFGDVLIGAPSANLTYLLYGPVSGNVDLGTADAILEGEAPGDRAGSSIGDGVDFNSDGNDDILIAATNNSSLGGGTNGAAYIVNGPITGNINLSSADVILYGSPGAYHAHIGYWSQGDMIGDAVFSTDANGDGLLDLLVSGMAGGEHITSSPIGYVAGVGYILQGPLSGSYSYSDCDTTLHGNGEDYVGYSYSSAGDTNNDGYEDIIISSPWAYDSSVSSSYMGAAYLKLGPISSGLIYLLSDAETRLIGDFNLSGIEVSSAGDIDGDNNDDILISGGICSSSSGDYSAYLMFGPVSSGVIDVSEADVTFPEENYEDRLYHLEGGRDIDNDGLEDILLGAIYSDRGGTDAGAAYLILGSSF